MSTFFMVILVPYKFSELKVNFLKFYVYIPIFISVHESFCFLSVSSHMQEVVVDSHPLTVVPLLLELVVSLIMHHRNLRQEITIIQIMLKRQVYFQHLRIVSISLMVCLHLLLLKVMLLVLAAVIVVVVVAAAAIL